MIRPVTLALLSCAVIQTAELVQRDFRVGASSLPVAFDWTVDSRSGSASGSDAFDAGLGIEAGGRWSFARTGDSLGLVLGADGLFDAWTYSQGQLGMTGVRVCAGPGLALSDRWSLNATAGVQYGLTRFSTDATASAPSFTATGTTFGYDLRLEGEALITRRFGLGLGAGWLIATHDLTGDDGISVTLDQSGWFVGMVVFWRFSDTPTLLE